MKCYKYNSLFSSAQRNIKFTGCILIFFIFILPKYIYCLYSNFSCILAFFVNISINKKCTTICSYKTTNKSGDNASQ